MISLEQNLLIAFWKNIRHLGVSDPLIWSQFLVVVGALLLGYGAAWLMKKYIFSPIFPNKKLSWQQKLIPFVFPVTSSLVVWVSYLILQLHYRALYLLDVADALLWVLLILRMMPRIVEVAFGARTWAKRTERWAIWTVWFLFALYVTGFSQPIIAFLEGVAFKHGKTTISLWGVLQTILVLTATVLIALVISYLIEARILRIATDNASLRFVLARLSKAFFIVLAFLIALPLVGIDLTVLSVFGGALGVGLGFGLQKIASNYVSGFSLLLDRSLRIGDMVQIGAEQGQVDGMTARYVVLNSLDGKVSLIPNEVVLSSVVINKTYTDQTIRVSVPVQVTYTSDIKLAMQLMLVATKGIERILGEPLPAVLVKGFAENGVNLELRFWIADEEHGTGDITSQISIRIWESFKEKGVEFSYPHRDISIVDIPAPLERLLEMKKSST